jgi:hypothetical protein
MKWFKRILIAMFLLAAIGLPTAWWLARTAPGWYRLRLEKVKGASEDQARRGQNRLLALRMQAAEAHGQGIRALRGGNAAGVIFAPMEFSISDEEINAMFYRWAPQYRWDEVYAKYLKDPIAAIQDGQIILAGRSKQWDRIVSVHFEPSLTKEGRLQLKLAGTFLGRFPMPLSLAEEQKQFLQKGLAANLVHWQKAAKLDSNGAANNDAMKVCIVKMLLNCLNGKTSDSVMLIQADKERWIPMRLTGINMDGNRLTVQGRPVPLEERAGVMEGLKGKD